MKPITMYQADDGSIHHTEASADIRDALIRDVAAAMLPLGAPPKGNSAFNNGQCYVKHSMLAVAAAKEALLELSKPKLGDGWEISVKAKGIDPLDVDPGWFCRLLDSGDQLSNAWGRMCCIDDKGREWGQMYYRSHPDECNFVEVAKSAV